MRGERHLQHVCASPVAESAGRYRVFELGWAQAEPHARFLERHVPDPTRVLLHHVRICTHTDNRSRTVRAGLVYARRWPGGARASSVMANGWAGGRRGRAGRGCEAELE